MKIIATDLDGTFLHDDKTFDRERFAILLKEWTELGNAFVIASGRELRWVTHRFGKFADQLHLVVSNGAVRRRVGHQAIAETLDQTTLAPIQAIVMNMAELPGGGFRAYTADQMYVLRDLGVLDPLTWAMADLYAGGIQQIDQLDEIDGSVTTLTGKWSVAGSEVALSALNGAGLPIFATTSGYGAVDILPVGVNKAAALAKLLDDLQASADDLIVFGDGMNDLEMLVFAGTGYVMPNADKRLFERGFELVPQDNNHDGVLTVMDQLIKQEKESLA